MYSLSLSILPSFFSSSSSFLDGGTRFHFNTSLQKPFFNRKKEEEEERRSPGLGLPVSFPFSSPPL
jgi:hypothetical protein